MKTGTACGALCLAHAMAVRAPSLAVILVDSTWAGPGGCGDDASKDGDGCSGCCGAGIGKDADQDCALFAAHCSGAVAPAEDLRVRSRGGSAFDFGEAVIHDNWRGKNLFETGQDTAILVLDASSQGVATGPDGRLSDLSGSGDSDGPAFVQGEGLWLVDGGNSNGNDKTEAGQTSVVRVSGQRDWIRELAPVGRLASRRQAPMACMASLTW
jgi:hypothetical protein